MSGLRVKLSEIRPAFQLASIRRSRIDLMNRFMLVLLSSIFVVSSAGAALAEEGAGFEKQQAALDERLAGLTLAHGTVEQDAGDPPGENAELAARLDNLNF